MAGRRKPKNTRKDAARTNAAPAELRFFSERLRRKLGQLQAFSSAVVEAPSGCGKTTAVREYLKSFVPRDVEVHWFTAVDEAPEAGFGRFCREIGTIDPRAGERLLRAGFPNAFTLGEACEALRSLTCARETRLVVDNFQSLCPGLPAAFLGALLEHGGAGLQVVVITQPLGLEMRAAVAGRAFFHLTAGDLRLDAEDIRRYYALAGVALPAFEAQTLLGLTDGWVMAVHLQLRAFRETGAFSHTAVQTLLEKVIWERLSRDQQNLLLRISPFETVTGRQMCVLLGHDELPEYALAALANPFIRHDPATRRYEPHAVLLELIRQKRAERGPAFERECLLGAGDCCRDRGETAEALGFYARIQAYERILALDLSPLLFAEIDNRPFAALALEIFERCPARIRQEHPLSMLRLAWALKAAGREAAFAAILEESAPAEDGARRDGAAQGEARRDDLLRAEWLLLSAYRHYPRPAKMLPLAQKAGRLFAGACSQVILPQAPWAFGNYFQLSEFHLRAGAADREADALEAFLVPYSRLTNGHGAGAGALMRAEIAYCRGDMAGAEIFAHKAAFLAENARQHVIRLGALKMLADIALVRADTPAWQRALDGLERAAAGRNDFALRPVLDTIRGAMLSELHKPERIADWLRQGDVASRPLLPPVRDNALYVHVMYLLHRGELARFLGTQKALPAGIIQKSAFSAFLFALLMAIGHMFAGDRARAGEFLERAAAKALPDGFILAFAASAWLLRGLVEELIAKDHPQLLDRLNDLKARFGSGWETLRAALSRDEPPVNLTGREREIALLAAEGLRNHEIAAGLEVTESTVRTHLRAIFQKLDIDRRAKLTERLK